MAETPEQRWLDPSVLARLTRQPLMARFPMEGSVSGHHKSPHRGSSVEFAEYRNYVPGDDIKRLDWRVFARTDRFFLKEFEADTNLRCCVVLDCSGSMNFSALGMNRLDYARRLAAALAYVAVHQGDAAGLYCAGEKAPVAVPPKRNPVHLRTILQTLDQVVGAGETRLPEFLHELAEKIRRRALVVVISDCFTEPEGLLAAFQHLRFQKHDLAVLHLVDPQEMRFTFDRPLRFTDLESAFSLVTEPAMVREEYLAQMTAYLEQLQSGCREIGADYRRVLTDQDYGAVLADFLAERQLSAGGRS